MVVKAMSMGEIVAMYEERCRHLEAENRRLIQVAVDTQDSLRRALDRLAGIGDRLDMAREET